MNSTRGVLAEVLGRLVVVEAKMISLYCRDKLSGYSHLIMGANFLLNYVLSKGALTIEWLVES